jgi:hypothetical protein
MKGAEVGDAHGAAAGDARKDGAGWTNDPECVHVPSRLLEHNAPAVPLLDIAQIHVVDTFGLGADLQLDANARIR